MSCNDMCPKSEELERKKHGDVSKFEKGNGFSMVKKYRSIAASSISPGSDISLASIRTPAALLRTSHHLIENIFFPYFKLKRGGDALREYHDMTIFLFDRFRSIRQDIMILLDTEKTKIVLNDEQIIMLNKVVVFQARTLIFSYYLLQDIDDTKYGDDRKLIFDQMVQSIGFAKEYQMKFGLDCLEILSLDILIWANFDELSLDHALKDIFENISKKSDKNNKNVQFAKASLAVLRQLQSNDFYSFFRYFKCNRLSFLQRLLLSRYIPFIRSHGLLTLSKASNKNDKISVKSVMNLFDFQSADEAIQFTAVQGLSLNDTKEFVVLPGMALANELKPIHLKKSPWERYDDGIRWHESGLDLSNIESIAKKLEQLSETIFEGST